MAKDAFDVGAHLDAPKYLKRLIVRTCLDKSKKFSILLVLIAQGIVSALDGLTLRNVR